LQVGQEIVGFNPGDERRVGLFTEGPARNVLRVFDEIREDIDFRALLESSQRVTSLRLELLQMENAP
jgi:hypothetical protein